MALHLNCSSPCLPDGATVTWYLLPNHTSPAVVLPVTSSRDYVASVDNGLVILSVNASQHVGTFYCQYNNHILTQHTISLSGWRFTIVFFLLLYMLYRDTFTCTVQMLVMNALQKLLWWWCSIDVFPVNVRFYSTGTKVFECTKITEWSRRNSVTAYDN